MFARKIRVEYEANGQRLPCPLKWLDSFSMRNFTNASVFDDTLPVTDGQMEIGSAVPLDQLKDAMEDWFQRARAILPRTRICHWRKTKDRIRLPRRLSRYPVSFWTTNVYASSSPPNSSETGRFREF